MGAGRCRLCGAEAPFPVEVGFWICDDHDGGELADLAEELLEADLEERDE